MTDRKIKPVQSDPNFAYSIKTFFFFFFFFGSATYKTGPGCSKLTTSLINVLLKFQMLISEIYQYVLLEKCKKLLQCKSFFHFFNKIISVFDYTVIKCITN